MTEWHQRFQGSLAEVAEVKSGRKKPEREGKWWRGVEQGGGGVEVESGRELRLGRGRGGIKPGLKPLVLSRPDRTIELATFEHYLSPSYANQPD